VSASVNADLTAADEHGPRRPAALLLWAGLAGLQIAAAFALADPDQVEEQPPIYEWSTAASALILYALLVLLTFGIASLYPSARRALGLRRFNPRFLWSAGGVVVVSVIVAAALEPILHAGEKQGIAPEEWNPDQLAPFLVNAIIIATWGPFAEELFYRGLGVTAVGIFGSTVAIVGTALAFGLAHGLLVALPPLVVFGLGLAWVRVRSDSVWPGFIAHAGYNAIGIAIAVATSI
jgi:membrane protease YdiL (CAAX protease family)